MNTSRIAVVAALATVAAWTAKAVAIASAGGLGRSPWEGPLFLLGFACLLVAVASIGLAAAVGQSFARRALSATASIVATVVVALLVNLVVARLEPSHPGWVWGELNLWVLALLALAAAARVSTRQPALATDTRAASATS